VCDILTTDKVSYFSFTKLFVIYLQET